MDDQTSRLKSAMSRVNIESDRLNDAIEAEEKHLVEELKIRVEAKLLLEKFTTENPPREHRTTLLFARRGEETKKWGLWLEVTSEDLVTPLDEWAEYACVPLRSTSREMRIRAYKELPALKEEIIREGHRLATELRATRGAKPGQLRQFQKWVGDWEDTGVSVRRLAIFEAKLGKLVAVQASVPRLKKALRLKIEHAIENLEALVPEIEIEGGGKVFLEEREGVIEIDGRKIVFGREE